MNSGGQGTNWFMGYELAVPRYELRAERYELARPRYELIYGVRTRCAEVRTQSEKVRTRAARVRTHADKVRTGPSAIIETYLIIRTVSYQRLIQINLLNPANRLPYGA